MYEILGLIRPSRAVAEAIERDSARIPPEIAELPPLMEIGVPTGGIECSPTAFDNGDGGIGDPAVRQGGFGWPSRQTAARVTLDDPLRLAAYFCVMDGGRARMRLERFGPVEITYTNPSLEEEIDGGPDGGPAKLKAHVDDCDWRPLSTIVAGPGGGGFVSWRARTWLERFMALLDDPAFSLPNNTRTGREFNAMNALPEGPARDEAIAELIPRLLGVPLINDTDLVRVTVKPISGSPTFTFSGSFWKVEPDLRFSKSCPEALLPQA